MSAEKKTKISSVHYKYVGTDEQFNSFIKNVIQDYIAYDNVVSEQEEENIVIKKSA